MIIRPYNPTARRSWFHKKRRRNRDAFLISYRSGIIVYPSLCTRSRCS